MEIQENQMLKTKNHLDSGLKKLLFKILELFSSSLMHAECLLKFRWISYRDRPFAFTFCRNAGGGGTPKNMIDLTSWTTTGAKRLCYHNSMSSRYERYGVQKLDFEGPNYGCNIKR